MSRIAPKKAFQILGVSPRDDFATVRRAWIRLVKENHPDVVGGDLDALTAKLTRINDAYDSLRWHSPDKVRIREERKAEAERREHTDRRTDTKGHGGPDHRTTKKGAPQTDDRQEGSQRPDSERRAEEARRAEHDRRQMPNGTADDRAGAVWATLSITERFLAAQALCGPDAAGPRRARRLATV